MTKKRVMIWSLVGLAVILAIGMAAWYRTALAAPGKPAANAPEANCNTCHDDLYYNYDLGKAYCVERTRDRCVDCHAGDPAALDKKSAHANLNAHPVKNGDDTLCQGCHGQKTSNYVSKFAQIAGFRSLHYAAPAVYRTSPRSSQAALPEKTAREELSWPVKILISLIALAIFPGSLLFHRLVVHK
jgi:hypothetical protein